MHHTNHSNHFFHCNDHFQCNQPYEKQYVYRWILSKSLIGNSYFQTQLNQLLSESSRYNYISLSLISVSDVEMKQLVNSTLDLKRLVNLSVDASQLTQNGMRYLHSLLSRLPDKCFTQEPAIHFNFLSQSEDAKANEIVFNCFKSRRDYLKNQSRLLFSGIFAALFMLFSVVTTTILCSLSFPLPALVFIAVPCIITIGFGIDFIIHAVNYQTLKTNMKLYQLPETFESGSLQPNQQTPAANASSHTIWSEPKSQPDPDKEIKYAQPN